MGQLGPAQQRTAAATSVRGTETVQFPGHDEPVSVTPRRIGLHYPFRSSMRAEIPSLAAQIGRPGDFEPDPSSAKGTGMSRVSSAGIPLSSWQHCRAWQAFFGKPSRPDLQSAAARDDGSTPWPAHAGALVEPRLGTASPARSARGSLANISANPSRLACLGMRRPRDFERFARTPHTGDAGFGAISNPR